MGLTALKPGLYWINVGQKPCRPSGFYACQRFTCCYIIKKNIIQCFRCTQGIIGNQVQGLNGPATVNGELKPHSHWETGKAGLQKRMIRESGDLPEACG